MKFFVVITGVLLLVACGSHTPEPAATIAREKGQPTVCVRVPARFPAGSTTDAVNAWGNTSTSGMLLVPGGVFLMGADEENAPGDEYPKHWVRVDPFWMDATEVTNDQFAQFVAATGYVTLAERKPDWEELKKQLPPGTPKPPEELLVASSLVFTQTTGPVNLHQYTNWWAWTKGADWKHPQGPGSTIAGKGNYPVVQVSWQDAQAYCKWAGKRLPTEAEWEWAARGGLQNNRYAWGNEPLNKGVPKANTWEGDFPYRNTKKDGFIKLAPVKSFAANTYGLYDMAGNVWQWCADWYDAGYYNNFKSDTAVNPPGAAQSNDPAEPGMLKRVLRGGSFLCNESYCAGYRVSARMKSSPDTGLEHTGFRCVRSVAK